MEYDEEITVDETCPQCGNDYDDIDFDYQICHRCGYNNDPDKGKEEKRLSKHNYKKTIIENDLNNY